MNTQLPKLSDLINETEESKKETELQVLLNQPPPEKWIKTLPNTSVKYLPIERVEFLLTKIFTNWSVEVKSVQVIANSVCVCIRLFYQNPLDTTKTLWQDGLAAFPMQTDKGAGATDISKLKNNAVQLAAPAAETDAIKDAAHKIGRIFGKDLNRSEQIAYDSLLPKQTTEDELKAMYNEKKHLFTESERVHMERIISQKEATSYDKLIQTLKSK
ncbi:MAG: Rad52/Rad22 family DNA repair protein [Acidiferrobacterales bacterium]